MIDKSSEGETADEEFVNRQFNRQGHENSSWFHNLLFFAEPKESSQFYAYIHIWTQKVSVWLID